MLILNILGLGLWLLIALFFLRFVAKNVNALLAMALFVAGYLALFNTMGTMFGYGLVVWGGIIGLGVMGKTLATRLGVRRLRVHSTVGDEGRQTSEEQYKEEEFMKEVLER